jgi:hypothetical protein
VPCRHNERASVSSTTWQEINVRDREKGGDDYDVYVYIEVLRRCESVRIVD